MIRECSPTDLAEIAEVINEAATAYRGVIPADRWHEPYLPPQELRAELAAGVSFWAVEEQGHLQAVMGLQLVSGVALIRHAYTQPASQGRGLGSELLAHLRGLTDRPMLVGTWAAATWAIRFYEGRGFRLVPAGEKDMLLRRYWTVPARQIETSVVLVDDRWVGRRGGTLSRQPRRARPSPEVVMD